MVLRSLTRPWTLARRTLASPPKPSSFVQDEPHHENPFSGDAFLIRALRRLMPNEVYSDVEPDLVRFGDRVRTDVWSLGRQCEAEPPFLTKIDAWGKRIDDLVTSEAWKAQKVISAEEGLVAIPYENKHDEFSRLYQMVKLALYSPGSGLYSCPLAMTDGAAKTLSGRSNSNLTRGNRSKTKSSSRSG